MYDLNNGLTNHHLQTLQQTDVFRLLINAVREHAIFMLDAHGCIVSWGDGAQLIKGYTESEITGRHFSLFYPPDKINSGEPAYNLMIAEKKGSFECEGWRVRKNGTLFWAQVVITALYNDKGIVQGYAEITRDITDRKSAAERTAYLASLIEQTSDAVISTDLNLIIKSWNEGARKMYGFTREEALEQPFDTLLNSPFTEKEREEFIQKIRLHDIAKGTFEYRHRNGERVVALSSVKLINDENGHINGYVVMHKDITEENKAEKKLRESEERFRLLVNSMKDCALFLMDAAGKVISWNEGAQRLKGYTESEIIGRHISVFYIPEAIERNDPCHNLEQAKLHGEFETQGWRVRKDGSLFWADAVFTALYDDAGNLRGFAQAIRDTTKRRLAAEEISRLAAIVKQAGNGIISCDLGFNVLTWNKSAEEMFGFTEQEVNRKPLNRFLRSDWSNHLLQKIIGELDKNGHCELEREEFRKNGTLVYGHFSFSYLKNLADEVSGYIVVITDISEKKEAERLLNQFNEELNRQVQEKTKELDETTRLLRELATRMQHVREEERKSIAREIHDQLGQLLTSLKMDIQWVRQRIDTTESAVTCRLQSSLTLLDNTIQIMRRISTELHPHTLDTLGLEAALEWQSLEFEKRSEVKVLFTSGIDGLVIPPAISITLFRIYQESLTNIARYADATMVKVSLVKEQDQLVFCIADDGAGFDMHKVAVRKSLGLLSMRERAMMIGGLCTIESAPGKGAVITITIPVHLIV